MEGNLVKVIKFVTDKGEVVILNVYKLDNQGGGFVGLDINYLGEVEDGVRSPYDTDDNEELNLVD